MRSFPTRGVGWQTWSEITPTTINVVPLLFPSPNFGENIYGTNLAQYYLLLFSFYIENSLMPVSIIAS